MLREQLAAAQTHKACPIPGDLPDIECAMLRVAEQFAVNVSGMDKNLIETLQNTLGQDRLSVWMNTVYLLDMVQRLQLVVPHLLPADPDTSSPGHKSDRQDAQTLTATDSLQLIATFAAKAVQANSVDPITSELVRLRCAQIHHCRLCGSLRQQSALDDGFNEDMALRIARYEEGGFSGHQTAALQLADTLIMLPATPPPSLNETLHTHFSPEQIAELCIDVVKWSQQKALVALESDAPPWDDVRVLDFDDDGHPVFRGPIG
jgi:hypothetical protein